jgi:DNA-binding CsgD family transcriptional regulator
MGPLGILDGLGINGVEANGMGCFVGVFLPARSRLTPRDRAKWSRVAAHNAAALRLRDRLDRQPERAEDAEAILDPEGRVKQAKGAAESTVARQGLRDAVRAVERARGKVRKSAPEEALEEWRALVQARWTLLDHFDTDGRRYVLARKNAPDFPPADRFSPRERQAVHYAGLGHSNKLIAYELGIATSTVGVLLWRAAAKVGAKTRGALIAAGRAVVPPGEREPGA